MEKTFILAFFTTLVFCLMKVIEMKYIEKKMEPLKNLVRECIFVFISSFVCGYFIIEYSLPIDGILNTITDVNVFKPSSTEVFTGVPDF